MSRFVLQTAIIIGAGLITGLAFALTSPVQLRVDIGRINKGLDQPIAKPPTGPSGPTGTAIPPTGAPGPTGPTGSTGQPAATTPQPPTGTGAPGTTSAAAPAANDVFITVDAAKAVFDSQQAVFIDARPQKEYLAGHIPNAMHLEKDALNGPPPAKVGNYLPGMQVIVYCHGELCTDSENVIKRLAALNKGIGPFRIIKDGFPGWIKAGHPTASGPEVGFE